MHKLKRTKATRKEKNNTKKKQEHKQTTYPKFDILKKETTSMKRNDVN
jgi:hypothetical protein